MTRPPLVPCLLLLGLLALAAPAAACESAGCTNIYGLPVEARLAVWSCSPDAPASPRRIFQADVSGRWTHKAHILSRDGQANVLHREDGVELHFAGRRTRLALDLKAHNPRAWRWAPDSRRVAFWAPTDPATFRKRVALLDVRRPKAPHRILYDPRDKAHQPFGLAWSPQGDAVYVIERVGAIERTGKVRTRIVRVAVKDGAVATVVERDGVIDFFSLSPLRADGTFELVYGAPDGLLRCDPRGKPLTPLDPPATGLHNIAWRPDGRQLAVYFRFPSHDARGKRFRGIYRIDLGGKQPSARPLADPGDPRGVFALWYSPTGKHLAWATGRQLRVLDAQDQPVVNLQSPQQRVSGLAFSPDGARVAYARGADVWVRPLDPFAVEPTQPVARFGADGKRRVCDVRWGRGRLLITTCADLNRMKTRSVPTAPKLRLPRTR